MISATHNLKSNFDLTVPDQAYDYMKTLLRDLMPLEEIMIKADIVATISQLKQEQDVLILGHNYMEPALYHTVADIKGDSLELAKVGAQAREQTLVVCGVRFMAETAKILSPDKLVLLPAKEAGCSLASSITAADVRELKNMYPGVPVVSYVNTYAEVKAETDICCTSSNAQAVVESLNTDTVIFIPDRYLAANLARETNKDLIVPERTGDGGLKGRRIVEQMAADQDTSPSCAQKTLISWPGECEVHEQFTVEDIARVREQFGSSVAILAHPECRSDVCEAADFSGSTSAMIRYVKESQAERYLLLTECAMADNVIAENKNKNLLRMCSYRCPHMATITLEMTLNSLQNHEIAIELSEEVRLKAYRSLERMINI
ncbi:MAG: quinolinate synthase NadA [Proteobacteria bacterium]|nr:quinolinate synthase NadA [Pseudomonadota bacterium]